MCPGETTERSDGKCLCHYGQFHDDKGNCGDCAVPPEPVDFQFFREETLTIGKKCYW